MSESQRIREEIMFIENKSRTGTYQQYQEDRLKVSELNYKLSQIEKEDKTR